MKTLRLLATLLLVALSTGLYSCGKDDLDREPQDQISDGTLFNDSDKKFAEYMDDYSDIKCRFALAGEGSMLLTGIKNKHLWFSEFDTITKKLKSTWLDIEETDTIQQVYIGYGEYKEMKIELVTLHYYKKTKTGDIVTFGLSGLSQTIFTSNGKCKRTPLGANGSMVTTHIVDWYDESVFIGNCCYSSEGDTLYIAKKEPDLIQGKYIDAELISYEEGLKFSGNSISKYNYKEAKSIWSTNIVPPFEVPSDAKRNYTVIDNSTNIWKYKVDVTFYDGTKKEYTFKINIETGKLASDDIKVTGISLNTATGEIEIGDTYELVASISPTDATNQNITWESSDDRIATVDDKGLVTAISEGNATITATTEDGQFSAQAVIQVLSSKRIVHIKSDDYDISLGYSNDKLSSYIWKYTDGDYDFNQNIAYNRNKVVITGEADGHDCIQTYTLNKEGYATSCSIPDREGKFVEVSFEYSKDGYLTKAIEIIKYNSETRSNAYSFTYSVDGNILKGSESDISGNIYTQSYGNVRNKSGIMDFAMSELLFDYQAAFYCGILGKPCTHLPSSCKETEVCEMGWSKTYDFIHTQDDNGYVTRTTIANSEGEAETLTYTYK